MINALDFATGDGFADDTSALQQALEGGNKTLLIPDGTYIISTAIRVFSDTRISATPKAVIRMSDGTGKRLEDWLVCNADPGKGNSAITITAPKIDKISLAAGGFKYLGLNCR